MLKLDALQLYALAVLFACAAFLFALCAWEIGALLFDAWRERKKR
jgi:hypothetical protein